MFNENKFIVLQYPDWVVVYYQRKYYYIDLKEQTHQEMELVGELIYNVNNQPEYLALHALFHNDCCGETDLDDNGMLRFLWFKFKEE